MNLDFSLIKNDDGTHALLVMDAQSSSRLELTTKETCTLSAIKEFEDALVSSVHRISALSATPNPLSEDTQRRVSQMSRGQLMNVMFGMAFNAEMQLLQDAEDFA